MSLTVEPLQVDELDEFIKTYWAAFSPLDANMIFPMIYPRGLQQDLLKRLRYRLLQQTNGDLGSFCVCAKDVASGEIVGIARWDIVEHPPKTKEEMDAKYEDVVEARQGEPPVAGVNEELNRVFLHIMLYCEMEITAGQPYLILQMLAIRPDCQRRGIGTVLLKHVLEKADREGLQVYLDSAVSGKALYERFGFKVVSEMPLNCLDYGGRSDGRHWCMLRLAQASHQNAVR